MSRNPNEQDGKVAVFPEAAQPVPVSDELRRILLLLQQEFPSARHVSLEFDGRLVAHIDVRNKSELDLIEARLPYIGGGHLFLEPRRGDTPHHPFHHRITASVAR